MLLPLLSEWDPTEGGEGSIDPLGLYAIADALATKLIPGVRERQQHPRFLTVMAAAMAVCNQFKGDPVAKDGISEPWMVFEWYVVEGLVRSVNEKERLRGLPGREKVANTIKADLPLSAKRYLKSPKVFGFHGVYRQLARTLHIDDNGILGNKGYELLDVWRKEQKLQGFYETAQGEGALWFRRLADAVNDGLKNGMVSRTGAWEGWQFMANHFCHDAFGAEEAKFVSKLLLDDQEGYRNKIIEFLSSAKGQDVADTIYKRLEKDKVWSERPFHQALITRAEGNMKSLLDAIMAYESFSRLLQDAFDDCLFVLTPQNGNRITKTTLSVLAEGPNVINAARMVSDAYDKAVDKLAALNDVNVTKFIDNFKFVSERNTPGRWVHGLIDHHRRIQQNKPPDGKLAWIVRCDDDSYIISLDTYWRTMGGRWDDSYVHTYRMASLQSFLRDLRLVE